MYVVIVIGGKQYKVIEGEFFKVEKFDVVIGEVIDFDCVLLVVNGEDVKIGLLVVEGVKVIVEVVFYGCYDKVCIIKFCCCKYYMKCQGYCQWFIEIKIIGIQV